ncbi:MAG: 8-amino-7-oxononanoate synthase [Candidatus Buchananbacteria bacterium RIFCSPHIGHO2_02_FULL_38_8]|uniref:8-amino-7-oxononanoate synthase n=2 Tax=Candidatus Buchananiibacteriota TaxID=1817903 RepID=A0A1G1XUP1_9BACT|nr:MAG: 8-amino-7-oxononanoate synthase [Candidatus Buchananbacteria bacterium RIFCSPHIGHO2_01_FULL_39_8]OGY47046.1 MAG: 8-amino-7-oxononanoate synthase [Candidatus Buchananbacteria bacterium RIFCSPHIGHO2_02_FULL_38_8]
METIKKILDYVDSHNLYPDLRIIEGGAEPEVIIDGKKVLMFSSNNYLGLATHPKVVAAAIEATKKYGSGSDGSRMLSGNLQIHRDFELAITKFKGGEDAIVWPTGYSANVGVISAVMNPPTVGPQDFYQRRGVIISDELNHASIIDGCKMSGQKVVVYKHCDVNDLEKKLKKYKNRRKLVVTDGVFSMDGDIAPLDKIVPLCKRYNSMLMIDEAHSTGVLGKNGHGTPEHFGLKAVKDIDIVHGTCSKALASTGGFVVGSRDLIRYLRITSRSYIFSTAMTPAASASLIAALNVIEIEPEIRERMWENVKHMRDGFHKIGFDTLTSETQIIPILIGSDENAIEFSRRLFEKGIFGPCVRWPAVEKGKARIRFTVMATHTKEQIDYLLKCCEEIGKELDII